MKPKIGVDAHGRLIKTIKPYVTGHKGCPTLPFHFLLKEQREKEIELDVAGVDATHSLDDGDADMDDSTPTSAKRNKSAPGAAAARRAGLFGIFSVFTGGN